MFRSLLAASLALTSTLRTTAAAGTPIPLDLYTDPSCHHPSTISPNVSLALDTCAVTPGLGSVVLNPYPCTSGDVRVRVYAYSDTSCGTQDDIEAGLESRCMERLGEGVYAAIVLSCDQEGNPGTPTATTTINVAPVATGASGSNGTAASGTDSSSSSSTSGPTSGWNSLSSGAKIGVYVGAGIVAVVVIAVCWGRRSGSQSAPSWGGWVHRERHYSERETWQQGRY